MKTYAIILSAGKQSRFIQNFPKTLLPYDDKMSIMDINIKTLSKQVDKIFVVLEKNVDSLTTLIYNKFLDSYDNIEKIYINSGSGTGDAILKTLNIIKYSIEDDARIVLIWGDSIQDSEILITTLLDTQFKYDDIILPLEEVLPMYTAFGLNIDNTVKSIITDKNMKINFTPVYHDYSIFMFLFNNVLNACEQTSIHINRINSFNSSNRFREFDFFDIINFKYTIARAIIIKNISSKNSYNTVDEYHTVIGENK